MKKTALLILVLMIALLTNTTAFAGGTSSKIQVVVNDKTVKYDVAPYLKKSEIMVPVRRTSEALGAKITWDKKSKTAWLHLDMMHVEIPVGKSEFYIHRDADFTGIPQTVKLNTPIKSMKGRVFVPSVAFYEGIGMKVFWNSSKRILNISDGLQSMEVPFVEITADDIKDNKALLKWYEDNKQRSGISYIKEGKYMYAIIGAGEKPTGGYSISIDEIFYSAEDAVVINATVTPPGKDMNVIMVLTYPSILIRIDSAEVVEVLGEVRGAEKADQDKLIAMVADMISTMELFDLNDEKIRDLTDAERDGIIKSLADVAVDDNSYILMITGNILKVTLQDGSIIRFTSYGSDTNVIAAFDMEGEQQSYHLVAPKIAKILLEK